MKGYEIFWAILNIRSFYQISITNLFFQKKLPLPVFNHYFFRLIKGEKQRTRKLGQKVNTLTISKRSKKKNYQINKKYPLQQKKCPKLVKILFT